MEIVTACGTSILSTIVEGLVKLTGRQVGYIFRFKSIIEDLNEEAENLRLAQVDMQSRVDRAIKDTDEIQKDVQKWLRDVTAVMADVVDLEKQTREKKTCFNGLCPNLIWRYQLARRAQKKKSIVLTLKDGGKFDNVSHRTTLSGINVLPQKDFMPFESTTYAFNLIIEALKDDKTNVVGLYGMGGVGKTTLAKAVSSKAKEEEIFNEVVTVVVSNRDMNKDEDNLSAKIRDIQGQLADFLTLPLIEESKEGRAARLKKRLEKDEKILIILDDIWEKITLADIGIPIDKDCKIFLTTRQEQVCIDMGCQSQIPLDVLKEEEGLFLFRRHSGLDDAPQSPTTINRAKEVEISLKVKLAKEIVTECKGLPLAIVAIGSALKEQCIGEWEMAVEKLRKSRLMDVGIVDEKLYVCLKLSYDYLKNEKTKSCFLLCSLFPEDHEIDMEQLVRYGPGFGLYQNTDSIEEARKELHVMVNRLKASSLLLDAKEGYVKMHDVVRDVALWITSKGEEVFMVKAGMGLTEWPKHEGLEQCTAISLMRNHIKVLPAGLECPKLKILLLDGCYDGAEVSDEFFEKMKTLKVASLSWIDLSAVESLRFLTNLVTLQLIRCKLSDISSIKKLAKLEILILKGSGIVELPEELRELSKLRMLDITDCRFLKRIPANVIPRLYQLEELYIGENSFKAWEVEGTSAERRNASLSELCQLNHLTILSLCIYVQPRLPKDFVLTMKLLRYYITVNSDHDAASYPKSRALTINNVEVTSLVAFKALCEKVESLGLVGIKGCCQNMVPSIDETGLNELKKLDLGSFDELKCIVDMTQQQDVPSTAFFNLVDLSLNSVGLREICSGGRPPRGFLENLETLNINSCHSMSCLFPSWVLIQGLRKLKKVTVKRCDELKDVFQLEGLCYAKENPFLLSSLERLDLMNLRNLRYIWRGPTQQVSLQSLTVVIVRSCNELRYLFTLSLARSLLQLEKVTVMKCDSFEYIVEIKEAEENVAVGGGGGNDAMFPKLRILQLDGLQNFINFCSQNYSSLQELSLNLPLNSTTSSVAQLEDNMLQTSKEKLHGFQNLEELKIRDCRVQVLSQLELSLPSLKELDLDGLKELECLCEGPTHLLSLPKLKKLSVKNCNRLVRMFYPSLARNLLQLEELIIQECGELEQIFNEDDAAKYNQTLSKDHLQWPLLFPNLSRIDIWRCDKLKIMFPVSITPLLSLQNLTTLRLLNCHGLTHLFSYTLARNLLQLESIYIQNCKELEQIIVEGHTEDDHVQLGLFPNLSAISVKGCGKLKTLFPAVTIARSAVDSSSQLEELFGHKDEADMTSQGEMELPQLQKLTLERLASLVHFCPVGYHFIFPSLSGLSVTKCPNITTRFSVDQEKKVHAESEAPQTGKEDVDQSPPETTREIKCWSRDSLQNRLPPYIRK